MRSGASMGWGFALLVVVILAINAIIWLPALEDCNKRDGVLVTNAFNLPQCVAGAGADNGVG